MSFISAGNTTTTTLVVNGDTTGNLVFNTGGANTTALTITNAQNATFANTASFTPGTYGIIFNNSSAKANSTFNDYETGTWTPTISPTSGSFTAGTCTGEYTKIGRLVTLNMLLGITTNGTGAGAVAVGSLPFASNGYNAYGAGREQNVQGFGLFGYLLGSGNTIYIQNNTNAYPGGTGYALGFSISYFASF